MTNELEIIKRAANCILHTPGWNQPCHADCLRCEAVAAVERLEAERQQLLALGNKFRSGDVGLCEIIGPVQFVEMLLGKLAERQSDTARLRSHLGAIAWECTKDVDTLEIYHQCYAALVGDFSLPADEQDEIMRAAIDDAIKSTKEAKL